MEENVALDSTQQEQFAKSIKGIKKLIKKNQSKQESGKTVSVKKKYDETKKRRRKDKGLVYLAHIPHGFYENEMTQYFKQFGMVTNVRVIRSKRTGSSKGYAFVEFKEPSVAQIVAETMNNYLMGKRLLKAQYIPPEKQNLKAMRKRWNPKHNPGSQARLTNKKAYNAERTDEVELKRTRKTLGNLLKTKQKLSDLGIDYNFFMPVDVPEELLSAIPVEVKENKVTMKSSAEQAKQDNKSKKKTISKVEEIVNKGPLQKNKELKKDEVKKVDKNLELKSKNKKNETELKVDDKQQKQKEQKLKEKGVKPPSNFIKVKEASEEEASDDSDSPLEFDSDEYEKMLDDDDDSLSEDDESDVIEDDDSDVLEDDGSEDDSDEVDAENDTESDKEELPRNVKGKHVPLVINPNILKQQASKKQKAQKRKALPAPPVALKKSKFEKNQNIPLVKKQFKKKK